MSYFIQICTSLVPKFLNCLFFIIIITVAHNHHSTSTEQNYILMPANAGMLPPQYNNVPHQINQYPSHSLYAMCSSGHGSTQNIPETHKSMWAINPLCTSNGGIIFYILKKGSELSTGRFWLKFILEIYSSKWNWQCISNQVATSLGKRFKTTASFNSWWYWRTVCEGKFLWISLKLF